MKLKPTSDNVVVKMIEVEETTASGIILAGSAKEKPQIAEVVAVGPGTEDVKMEVKSGEKIIMKQYSGTNVKLDNEEYIIIKQSDILATVE